MCQVSKLFKRHYGTVKHIPLERSQQALQHRQGLGALSIGAQSACKKLSPKFGTLAASQTSSGIVPVSSFRCSQAKRRLGRSPNWLGIGPVNWLLLTLNCIKRWSCESSVVGRDPVNSFLSSIITREFVILQSSTGIVPESLLPFSVNVSMLVS